MTERWRTRTCDLVLRDGLIHATFLPEAEVGLEDAQENIARTAELARGARLPVLVDLREIRSQSAEARAHLAGPEADAVSSAVALVIGSPLSRMVGNFFLGFNRPNVPTRLFTSVDDAESWLRGLGA
ncbi:MAG: hypothetical protein K1X94_02665 [Sandaracinaceae bacterium]|nr:hypothetical protein [Sandaracinaceae bacterium]